MLVNPYAEAALDRVAHLRSDEGWIRSRLNSDGTLFVPVWRSRNLVIPGKVPAGALVPRGAAKKMLDCSRSTVLLGVGGDTAYFAIDLSPAEEPERNLLFPDAVFTDLRTVGAVMDRVQASILAYAKGILHWHARHEYCGVCGSPTEIREAGHLRLCQNPQCGAQHFPRTDPAVIMLVHRGDRVLLGRKSEWMEGMYSTLAGFVEPGESLEQAVAREVMEESGVPVTDIRYHSSQPWPFPASLMLGFFAAAEQEEFERNIDELEDLRWFTRGELMDGGAGIARRPRSDSIARRLIDDWIHQG